MLIDIAGRISNVYLPRTKALLPLFETIVNSIDALEYLNNLNCGEITVYIERDHSQGQLLDSDTTYYPIKNFLVEDNGPGFNEDNFVSFKTSDTTYKKNKGGKGIGRFLWLKAFDSVTIQSVFRDGQAYRDRTFNFLLSANGIEGGETFTPSKQNSLKTTVHLKGFKKDFEEQCPKKPSTIAHKIIEHCLSVFLSDNCPNIFLVDGSDQINLKLLFQKEYQANSLKCTFKVKSETFNMASMKLLRSSDPYNHRMHYCANNREVLSEPLKDDIPDLNHKITTTDGEPFSYLTFVSGEYLDKSVNSERTDFNIPKEPTSLLKDIVSV